LKLQITVEGKTYEVEVEVLEEDQSLHQPSYGPYQPFSATPQSVPAPGIQSHDQAAKGNAEDVKLCRSPVTGLVIKVNVAPGQSVQQNDLIMVLEAMKMEANVTAPGAGIVKSVNVAPGDSVKVNQVVVEFE
jgi:methylmalonyl-CoA carboxyltransferase small subunit